MAKIDLTAITKGLQKVQDRASAMETVARDELVDADLIYFAENNPYSEADTRDELEALAEDIKVNGLLHPLVVHQENEGHYTLISGEKRFKAINTLGWKRIPCRVYSGLSPDRAQLMLHSANLSAREYTAEQKLRFYMDADALLRRMRESGEYTGPLQKGLAALLNVSDRQIRRYKSITEKFTPEQKAEVASGDMSMRTALELISDAQREPAVPIALPWDAESTAKQESEPSKETMTEAPEKEPEEEEVEKREDIEPEDEDDELEEPEGVTERLLTIDDLQSADWQPWLEDLIHSAYNCSKLYKFYVTQLPTPLEAGRDFLCPPYFHGGTLSRMDGFYELTHGEGAFLRKDGEFRVRLTYSMVDAVVRDMIRRKSLLPESERKEILLKL